ncbi:hypothetical protein LJR290_003882 [Variovorax sp. LjRoot290]
MTAASTAASCEPCSSRDARCANQRLRPQIESAVCLHDVSRFYPGSRDSASEASCAANKSSSVGRIHRPARSGGLQPKENADAAKAVNWFFAALYALLSLFS